jgi:hypothetical protein
MSKKKNWQNRAWARRKVAAQCKRALRRVTRIKSTEDPVPMMTME